MSTKTKQMSALLAVDLVNLPEHFVVIFRRGGKYALARGAAECLVIEGGHGVTSALKHASVDLLHLR